MSFYRTTYTGPHIVCKTHKVSVEKTIRTCSNSTCSQYELEIYGNVKFCDQCGSPVQNRLVNYFEDNIDSFEVRMNLDEALSEVPGDDFSSWMKKNDVHIWISNRHIPNVREFSFDDDGVRYVPITAELIADELEKFSVFFEKEIFILKEEYGAENVELKWGLIHYTS